MHTETIMTLNNTVLIVVIERKNSTILNTQDAPKSILYQLELTDLPNNAHLIDSTKQYDKMNELLRKYKDKVHQLIL